MVHINIIGQRTVKTSPETIAALESIKPFATYVFTVIITAFATYLFTVRHFRKQKRHEFLQRRLDELYGPLLGLIKQVRANAKARLEARIACDKAWHEICGQHPTPFLDHEKYFEPFKRQIEYENERFQKEDLPAYDAMLDLLKKKNHLAYPSTLEWFDQFTQYVDHWHRPLPAEALMELGISEEQLLAFYAEVERQCNQLIKELSGDKTVHPDACTERN